MIYVLESKTKSVKTIFFDLQEAFRQLKKQTPMLELHWLMNAKPERPLVFSDGCKFFPSREPVKLFDEK